MKKFDFYTLYRPEYHSHAMIFSVDINWNIEAISKASRANGFIVQHIKRISDPNNFVVNNTEYYEAWEISNGVNLDSGSICDDIICVNGDLDDAYVLSLGTKGQYTIKADIYWVPLESTGYQIVSTWPRACDTYISDANGLRASYSFDVDDPSSYFIASRPNIIHKWSLLTDLEIENSILIDHLRMCPKATERDLLILDQSLNSLFSRIDPKYASIKENVRKAWLDKMKM